MKQLMKQLMKQPAKELAQQRKPVAIVSFMEKKPQQLSHRMHPGILADSKEVLKQFYLERISSLELLLQDLNFLDDACDISCYCREIIDARKKLKRLEC